MFCKGEYVVYGSNGVCLVEGIQKMNLKDIPNDLDYYVLRPESFGGKIYIPVNAGESKMRRVISKNEAEELIRQLRNIDPLNIVNEKPIEENYKSCIEKFDCIDRIRLIKCIYQRKQQRLSEGKKITSTDEKYMHMAEDALYSELGIALNIPKEQVLDYIIKKIEK